MLERVMRCYGGVDVVIAGGVFTLCAATLSPADNAGASLFSCFDRNVTAFAMFTCFFASAFAFYCFAFFASPDDDLRRQYVIVHTACYIIP